MDKVQFAAILLFIGIGLIALAVGVFFQPPELTAFGILLTIGIICICITIFIMLATDDF